MTYTIRHLEVGEGEKFKLLDGEQILSIKWHAGAGYFHLIVLKPA